MIFTYNGSDCALIALSLIDASYRILNESKSAAILESGQEYCLYINTNTREFTILTSNECEPPCSCHTQLTLEKIGVSRSVQDQKDYLTVKYANGPLKFIKNKFEDLKNKLEELQKDPFYPGRVIRIQVGTEVCFGILLTESKCIYFNEQGQIKGYATNLNLESDKILGIYEPTEEHYKVQDYKNMDVIWERKNNVKKSIAEIEKELGLDPGTLEISND